MAKIKNEELNRLSVDEYKNSDKLPIVIVLDNIRSLNNIGSVFRTADCFRLKEIHLCGITATPPHREIQKTALGATESVDWKYFENTKESITELKKSGYQVYAIEQAENSISLENFVPDSKSKYALIFGNEINGVDDKVIELSDHCIEIPQYGTKHSFNISVSVGIVMWQLYLYIK
jgi:tRNA G18 (ribose-2'-O)-methylase SpoU